jgi:S-adenosylmethionine synthetase
MTSKRNISIEKTVLLPMNSQPVELVERKGTGHPDTICDSIMEAVCIRLCREYQQRIGHICHHNIDKGLLVAGRTIPAPGGGIVVEPMKIIFGDRATYSCNGEVIQIGALAEDAAKQWIREHLRFVDPEKQVIFQNEIKPGSAELTDVFSRKVIGANDTSVGVGYAPLSETERLVLAAEKYLNSPGLKKAWPEVGEDIKIMGYRFQKELTLTVAIAFVDRYVPDPARYFERKAALTEELVRFVASENRLLDSITVDINTLDDPARGDGGMYLTVLGTSAEGGDGGQVGRGNRVNGLISFNRPQTTEAAAGKNPVNHVGKIYNVLSHEIASRIFREVRGLSEVTVYLCSQIGKPVDHPLVASAQIMLEEGVLLEDVRGRVVEVIESEFEHIHEFTARLSRGEFTIC